MNNLLINRKDIFKEKKTIVSELSKLQNSLFDIEIYQEIDNEIDRENYIKIFDALNYEKYELPTFETIVTVNHNKIKTFPNKLSNDLMQFFDKVKTKELYILSGLKNNFLGNRSNKYKPFLNVYKKLEIIANSLNYEEAFIINNMCLKYFTGILFWLVRCDPNMDYIFLFDKYERFYINICKYGNLHITEIGEKIIIKEILEELDWKIIEGREYDNFAKNGKTQGRKIKL